MPTLAPPLRRANPEDAQALADLINEAGEGLPLYLWERMAEPGEGPWDVGRRRARREEGSFSYRNAFVVDEGAGAIAMLIGYTQPDSPEPIDYETLPPLFVPLQELENLAPGTWYVNVLATYAAHRGRGHGARLLALAETLAREAGARGLSVIVADRNTGARRLYERSGYREVAKRPMVKNGWTNPSRHWVLLTQEI